MNRRHARMTLVAVAAGCAAAWWIVRPPAPVALPTTPIAPAPDATFTRPEPQQPVSASVDEQVEDAELETMAGMFAAEPALIDALEDATGASDPAVREDAENFLNALELPAPNPEVAAE